MKACLSERPKVSDTKSTLVSKAPVKAEDPYIYMYVYTADYGLTQHRIWYSAFFWWSESVFYNSIDDEMNPFENTLLLWSSM